MLLTFLLAFLIAFSSAGPGKKLKKGEKAGKLKPGKNGVTDGFGYGDCTCKKDSGKYKQKDMTLKYLGTKTAKKIEFVSEKDTSQILCTASNNVAENDEVYCSIDTSSPAITQFPTETQFTITYDDGVTPNCVGTFHTSCSKDIIGWLGDGCELLQVIKWSSTDPTGKDCSIKPNNNSVTTTTKSSYCEMLVATFVDSDNGYPFVTIMQKGFSDAYCFYIEGSFEASYYQSNTSTNPVYDKVKDSDMDFNIDSANIDWYYEQQYDRFKVTLIDNDNPNRLDELGITFSVVVDEGNVNQCKLKYSVDLTGYQWIDDSDNTKYVLMLQFVDCKDKMSYSSGTKASKSKSKSKKSSGITKKTKRRRRRMGSKTKSVKGTKKDTSKRKTHSRASKPGMSSDDSHEYKVGVAELFEPGIALSYNCPNTTNATAICETKSCQDHCRFGDFLSCDATSDEILQACCKQCCEPEPARRRRQRRRLVQSNRDINVQLAYHTTDKKIHFIYDRFCDLNADPELTVVRDLLSNSDYAISNYQIWYVGYIICYLILLSWMG